MTDDHIKKSDFKGVAAIASAIAVILVIVGGWNTMKDAIVEEVVTAIDRERETRNKEIAQIQLHLACWASASLEEPARQLPLYIYCREGKISKDVIAR